MKKSRFGDRDIDKPVEAPPIISSCASSARSESSSDRSDSITSSRSQNRKGLNLYRVRVQGYNPLTIQADDYKIESQDPYAINVAFIINLDQHHSIVIGRFTNIHQIEWINY